MRPEDPFDATPDPVLGARLRAVLDAGDDARFVQALLARLTAQPRPFEVLAGWARPGIAAALVIASALGYWVARRSVAPFALDLAAELSAADPPLDRDVLLGVALDDTP